MHDILLVVIGAGISLISSTGLELFKEWRTEKKSAKAARIAFIDSLQDALIALEHDTSWIHAIRGRDLAPERELAAHAARSSSAARVLKLSSLSSDPTIRDGAKNLINETAAALGAPTDLEATEEMLNSSFAHFAELIESLGTEQRVNTFGKDRRDTIAT